MQMTGQIQASIQLPNDLQSQSCRVSWAKTRHVHGRWTQDTHTFNLCFTSKELLWIEEVNDCPQAAQERVLVVPMTGQRERDGGCHRGNHGLSPSHRPACVPLLQPRTTRLIETASQVKRKFSV